MDSLDASGCNRSLARPLGCGEVGPIELPERVVRTRSRDIANGLPGGRWAALGGFAILGTTAILVASGPSTSVASGELNGKVWQDRPEPDRSADVDDHDDIYALQIDGLPNLGRSDAKVTLVVVSEYSRPWSQRVRSTLTSLRAAYGKNLKIVFKPYASSEAAVPSLAGACAASLQGEFEAFDNARSRTSAVLDSNGVFTLARELSLDMTRFASALRRCETLVKTSTAELDGYGFTGQAYFVNGKIVDPWGLESIATFETLIDHELVRAKQRVAAGASAERYYQEFVLAKGKTTR